MHGRIVAGLVIAAIGVLLLLDRMEKLEFDEVFHLYWPLILVVVGLVHLAVHRGRGVGGLILVALGLFFIADNLGWFPKGSGPYVWPTVLIVLGVAILLGAFRRGRHHGRRHPRMGAWSDEGRREDADTIQRTVAFSGLDARFDSPSFRGGSVTAMFGGAVVDLRGATLASDGARLSVTAFCGGVEIIVPPGMPVRVSGVPFLGGIEDKTARGAPVSGPALDIRATAIFGGVEIANER